MIPACATTVTPPASIIGSRPTRRWALRSAGAGTDWSLASGLGGGRSDVFQAGLYGSKRWGPAYVSGALAYSTYWMSTDRFVSVFGTDHLTSSFTAHNFGGRIESGYRFAMPGGGHHALRRVPGAAPQPSGL